MFIASGVVAAVGVLDLDDFSAKIGKCLGTCRSGYDTGEIHDQQPLQRDRRTLSPRRASR